MALFLGELTSSDVDHAVIAAQGERGQDEDNEEKKEGGGGKKKDRLSE